MLTSDYRYNIFALITVCLIMSLAWIESDSVAASSGKTNTTEREFYPTTRAVAANRHSVHVGDMAVRANSGFHLLDGADIQTSYSGDARAISALRSESIQSLSLATDDFNQDGAPDLIAGYSADGRGVIAMYKGNIDAFAPRNPEVYEAIQSGRTPASFDPIVQVFDVPESPDFMVIGDFNHDGKKDILAAAHGGGLYLLPGDDEGGFGNARAIALPGSVTTLTASGANVAVGITNETGPSVLVFSSVSNGLQGQPSRYALTAEATSLAFDSLDNDQYLDLAAAAGNEVVILHGQARGFATEHINVGFNIQSLTLGSFVWNRANNRSMALLGDDGSIQLLERSDLDTRPFSDEEAAALKPNALKGIGQSGVKKAVTRAWQSAAKSGIQWTITKQLGTSTANSVSDGARQSGRQLMLTTQVSPREVNDLLVIDQSAGKVNLLKPADDHLQAGNAVSSRAIPQAAIDSSSVSMNVDGTPAAVLLMRRKANGERDLIVLRANQAAPSSVIVTPQATITVDRVDDSHASACTSAPNDCSLRGAIDFANANPGTQINLPDPNTIGGSNHTYLLTIPGTHETNNVDGDLDIVASGTMVAGFGPKPIIQQTVAERVFDVNFASAANFFCELDFFVVKGGQDTSGLGGGGVLMGGPGNQYILDADFNSNRVNGTATNTPGGAVSDITGGTLFVFGGSFTNNDSGTSRGGAIFVSRTLDKDARLTIGNASFVNNQASGSGGAIVEEINGGTPSFDDTIFANQFTGNKVIASAVDAQGGGAIVINVVSNTVDLNRNTFINNQVSVTGGHGGAISITSGKSISKYNRFVGNTAENGNTVFNFDSSGTNDFTDNWWASLTGPKANDIVSAGGTFTTSPWITLSISPSLSTVPLNSLVMVTASLAKDSANNSIPDFFILAMTNVPISFGGTGGNITTAVPTTQSNGMAGALFNVTSPGIDTATATVDGATASTNITVIAGPTISTVFGAPTIPLNGSTSLSFTIQNSNASTTLTGIGFTDSLPAGLVVATPPNLTGSCDAGTIQANAGSNFIFLTGAQLASGASCTFSVDVTGTTAGVKTNTTGNVQSNESDFGSPAISTISVVAPPSITKSFSFPNVGLNQATGLKFIINNPFANSVGQTGVAFTDTLPAGMVVATPNALSNTCSGTVTATAGSGSVSLSGGSIPINGSCTIVVNIINTTLGTKNNSVTVTSTNGGTGNTSNAGISVALPPTITTFFSPATIPLNGFTNLMFEINNPNGSQALSGLAFTDTLPAGIVVGPPAGIANICGGTITAVAGSGSISLSGGTLATNATCVVSVSVQGTTAGVKNNSVTITSNEGGTGNTSNASITVVAPPVTTMAFGAASIPWLGSTSLSFTIQNNNTSTTLHNVGFSDLLPSELRISTPNGLTGSCGGGTIFALPADRVIALNDATLAPGTSCTFSVNVQGLEVGVQSTSTGSIFSTEGGTGTSASASINVEFPPLISKRFDPSTIALNATTTLTFTITNPALNVDPLIGVAFTDDLPSGLTVQNASTAVCGGTLTLTAPGNIVLSGATINIGSKCPFSVIVTGTASGQFTNTTSAVTSTNGGTGGTATANLTVAAAPTISKAFGIGSMPVNSATALTFTITNPNSGLGLTGVGFTDNLPAGLVVATPNGVTGTCGLGIITANAGSGTISLTGASIAASGVCSLSVNVTGTSVGVKNNTTGNITATESGTGGTASASITILSRTTTTSLSFSANPTVFGQTIQVTATVVDSAPAPKSSPTGTVSFASGAGTDQFNPVGCNLAPLGATTDTSTCTVNLTSTVLSTHSITGTYAGSAVHAGSNGSSQLTVNKASSLTTLTADFNPGVVGQHINILAAVTAVAPGAGTPTGSVAFLVDGVPVGSDSVNNPGPARINTEFLTGVGNHTIVANYSGDGGFIASSSSITLTINKASTTTTLTSSVNPSSLGQSVTFTATVKAVAPSLGNPQGIVSFMDGNTLLGTGTVFAGNQGQSTTFTTANLSVGTHQITAVFDGEPADYIGSSSPVLNQTVTKPPTATALTSSANPSVFGQAVTFTATVTSIGPPVVNPGGTTRRTGVTRTVQTRTEATRAVTNAFGIGTPSGTVTFFDGATQIGTGTLNGSGIATFTTAALSAGVHTVTASYGGDAGFQSSTSPALTQTVNKANTTSVLVSSANPSVFGQPVTITVTVTAASPGAGTPSGSVTILGLLPPGLFPISVPLNGSGVATQTFTNLAVGTYNVSANYSGDDNFNFGRSNLINQVVNKAATTTAITSSTPLAAVGGPVTYTATINPVAPGAGVPSGTVQFRDNGANIGGLVTLVAGQASVTESGLTFGLHTITAVYSGDGSFLASNGTLSGGQNVGLQFTDPGNGNKLIIDVVNSRYTFIAVDGTVVANNVAVTLEFTTAGTRVLRFTSANPIVAEVLIDESAPGTLQAKFYVPSTGKDFVMNITSGVKFTP